MKLTQQPTRKRRQAEPVEHVLGSGRTLSISPSGDSDLLEVHSPDGEVEVRITLTPAGPVVQVRAARLELESAGTVRFDCRKLEANARAGIDLHSAGEVRVDGTVIRLNSPEPVSRSGPSDSPGR